MYDALGWNKPDLELKLQTGVPEVVGSNLGQETGYPEGCFSWFSTLPPGNVRIAPFPSKFPPIYRPSYRATLLLLLTTVANRIVKSYILFIDEETAINSHAERLTNTSYS
jgi:hypothetical protein